MPVEEDSKKRVVKVLYFLCVIFIVFIVNETYVGITFQNERLTAVVALVALGFPIYIGLLSIFCFNRLRIKIILILCLVLFSCLYIPLNIFVWANLAETIRTGVNNTRSLISTVPSVDSKYTLKSYLESAGAFDSMHCSVVQERSMPSLGIKRVKKIFSEESCYQILVKVITEDTIEVLYGGTNKPEETMASKKIQLND